MGRITPKHINKASKSKVKPKRKPGYRPTAVSGQPTRDERAWGAFNKMGNRTQSYAVQRFRAERLRFQQSKEPGEPPSFTNVIESIAGQPGAYVRGGSSDLARWVGTPGSLRRDSIKVDKKTAARHKSRRKKK